MHFLREKVIVKSVVIGLSTILGIFKTKNINNNSTTFDGDHDQMHYDLQVNRNPPGGGGT